MESKREQFDSGKSEYSIVALDKFIQATRDSGYKGTSSAISELVDNSIQAGAKSISVNLFNSPDHPNHPICIRVQDDGCGMGKETLRQALRFGGSSRFNDREGLGRYGMGLPNSSFSQAKRVEVLTWVSTKSVHKSYLDIDEIASGALRTVPEPLEVPPPSYLDLSPSGTAVTWLNSDRLENRRISTISRKLFAALGRKFRYHIWNGVDIFINDEIVEPIDPLYLNDDSIFNGAHQFGNDIEYEVQVSPGYSATTGVVKIRFSELPVEKWSKLSNQEKRARGISKGAGVSIIRSGREVDYGWFFLAGKRRENYDDWWRCEIHFDPVLDEAFGITHTKQQIRPLPHLIEAISGDIVTTARALNNRARKAHTNAKFSERFSASEELADKKDDLLTPLPKNSRARDEAVLNCLNDKKTQYTPERKEDDKNIENTKYRILPKRLSETTFFNYARNNGKLVLVINPEHPFYKLVYKPLLDSENPRELTIRSQIDLLLLAAARSEALLEGNEEVQVSESFRKGWSDTLATYLNG